MREVRPDDRIKASRQPHRRGLKKEDRLSEKAESPLGRLSLRGIVTNEQHDAGVRYAVIVGEYRAVIEAPKSVGGNGRGYPCPGDCPITVACECLQRRRRYDRAYRALWDVGQRAAKIVARVAVHREEPGEEEIANLVAGLQALARLFGLTEPRPRDYARNTH